MKKAFFYILLMLTITYTGCKKEIINEIKENSIEVKSKGKTRIKYSQIYFYNDRLVFKTDSVFAEVYNEFDNPEVRKILEDAMSQTEYEPMGYGKEVIEDSVDVVAGFILNSQGLVQIKKFIYKIDFENSECRVLDVKYENDALEDLINGDYNEHIVIYPIDSEMGDIAYGSCVFCVLGGVAVTLGCPAGLLELAACVHCYYSAI